MRPNCAKCKKPVDSVDVTPDEDADGVEMTYHCHGATDRTFLTRIQFATRAGTSEALLPDEVFVEDGRAIPLGYRH